MYQHYRTFLGKKIDVKQASEPSDIIWENRMYTPFQRGYKTFIVFIIVVIMLLISFFVVMNLQKTSMTLKARYPHQNCTEYETVYKGQHQEWLKESILEYDYKM